MPGIMIPLVRRLEIEEYAIQKGFEQEYGYANPRKYVTRVGIALRLQPSAEEDITKCFFLENRDPAQRRALITTTRHWGPGFDALYVRPKGGGMAQPEAADYCRWVEVYKSTRELWTAGVIAVPVVIGLFTAFGELGMAGISSIVGAFTLYGYHDRKIVSKEMDTAQELILTKNSPKVEIFYGHHGLDELGFEWRKHSPWKPWVKD